VGTTQIVFETHSFSEDNERGLASGWSHSCLSARGRLAAVALGERRREDGIDLVAVSDLRRAVQTAEIAFAGSDVPMVHDWRLRECDYGDLNARPADEVHSAVASVRDRYPGGESWVEAIERVGGALDDLTDRWAGRRILVIGHMSGYWALEHYANQLPIESVRGEFEWQEGWEYRIER
jgi:broad specificity phosphatase PhoE